MANLALVCYMISYFLINHAMALKNVQFGSNADTSEKIVVDSKGSSEVLNNTSEVLKNAQFGSNADASEKMVVDSNGSSEVLSNTSEVSRKPHTADEYWKAVEAFQTAFRTSGELAAEAIKLQALCGVYWDEYTGKPIIIGVKHFFHNYFADLVHDQYLKRHRTEEISAFMEGVWDSNPLHVFIYIDWCETQYAFQISGTESVRHGESGHENYKLLSTDNWKRSTWSSFPDVQVNRACSVISLTSTIGCVRGTKYQYQRLKSSELTKAANVMNETAEFVARGLDGARHAVQRIARRTRTGFCC